MDFLDRLELWSKNEEDFLNNFRFDPYFIAEIGVNHEGSIEEAKKLIRSAKENGANAVKFQSYKAEKLTIKNSPAYWDQSKESTNSQFKLFNKYDSFNSEDYFDLKKFSSEIGIEFLTTPFDLDFVEELDEILPFYKVASADITNFPLLKKISSKQKPIILSTGASNIEEIKTTLEYLSQFNVQVILNHCVLSYPTQISDANLGMILDLKNKFSNMIGYSDHTVPDDDYLVLICAISLGAVLIEKHFTLDKKLPGNDHYHAFDGNDLKSYKNKLQKLKLITGKQLKEVLDVELPARENARRSLVFSENFEQDTKISENMMIAKRPGGGISPSKFNEYIGKTLKVSVKKDEVIKDDHFL